MPHPPNPVGTSQPGSGYDGNMTSEPVGRVAATAQQANTAEVFHFWTRATDAAVGIGTVVVVRPEDHPIRAVYGVVVQGEAYTDLVSPLHDYIGAEGDPSRPAPTLRPEIRCYQAAVLRTEPEEPLQPVPGGPVYLASDRDLQIALSMDGYADRTGIPLGLYGGEDGSPVYLDEDFLLGPESAHLNITGISGLATKTSTLEFLVASLFAHSHKDLAVVCFNVKGSDLLYLDLPNEALDDRDRKLYERLGVPTTPFSGARYFAPYREDGVNLNTLRTHEALFENVTPLHWGLREVLPYVHVLLNRDDIDAKADAFISFLEERVVDREVSGDLLMKEPVVDFASLDRWFERVIEAVEDDDENRFRGMWKTHSIHTIRKVRNRLVNLTHRSKGLINVGEAASDLPWGRFEDRGVYVVDIANVDELAQELVITRVVDRLRRRLEQGDLGVGRVIVFFDELNKYAPSDGGETYLKQTLLDIAERGRYLGLVLFSAQQFRSQVHKRIVGNCGTNLLGRMDMDELATPGYGTLSPAIKAKLSILPKGKILVRHPHFAQPIFVDLPRPPVMRGQDGKQQFPPVAELPFEDAVVRLFRRLDPLAKERAVRDLIADYPPEEVIKGLYAMQIKCERDPIRNFAHHAKAKPVRRGTPRPVEIAIEDPF